MFSTSSGITTSSSPRGELKFPPIAHTESLHQEALARRQDAARQLVQVKRELRREQAQTARADVIDRKHQLVMNMRSEMDALAGRLPLPEELVKAAPSEASSVVALSLDLNIKLQARQPLTQPTGGTLGLWYSVYKELDTVHSGRISYESFCAFVHELLPQGEREQHSLANIWNAMDEEGTGYISQGGFGAFMRRGATTLLMRQGGGGWRKRMQLQKRAVAETVRSHVEEVAGKDVTRRLASLTPATEVELGELAATLWRFINKCGRTWYSLFKECDADGTGRISIAEFGWLLRRRLPHPPSERLICQAWRALDKDRRDQRDQRDQRDHRDQPRVRPPALCRTPPSLPPAQIQSRLRLSSPHSPLPTFTFPAPSPCPPRPLHFFSHHFPCSPL